MSRIIFRWNKCTSENANKRKNCDCLHNMKLAITRYGHDEGILKWPSMS